MERLLELTNAERQKAGLAPLMLNPWLGQAAQTYAQVLSDDTCFGHYCGPVPDVSERIEHAGYSRWISIGENVAAGYVSPEAVVAGWMDSQGHRANILSPKYTEIGVGLAGGGKYGSYWTEDFGNEFVLPRYNTDGLGYPPQADGQATTTDTNSLVGVAAVLLIDKAPGSALEHR